MALHVESKPVWIHGVVTGDDIDSVGVSLDTL
jgi:hypothetical protein